MASKDWKFVFRRRGWSLSSYILDCKTINDVEEKFKKASMTVPTGKELASAGWGASLEAKENTFMTESVEVKRDNSVKKLGRQRRKKAQQTKVTQPEDSRYDELIVIETEE